jgi:hypothetical protein
MAELPWWLIAFVEAALIVGMVSLSVALVQGGLELRRLRRAARRRALRDSEARPGGESHPRVP